MKYQTMEHGWASALAALEQYIHTEHVEGSQDRCSEPCKTFYIDLVKNSISALSGPLSIARWNSRFLIARQRASCLELDSLVNAQHIFLLTLLVGMQVYLHNFASLNFSFRLRQNSLPFVHFTFDILKQIGTSNLKLLLRFFCLSMNLDTSRLAKGNF